MAAPQELHAHDITPVASITAAEPKNVERSHSRESHELDPKFAVFAEDVERRQRIEKKLKRKLDLRCSLFVLIYIMNYLDRNNIATARQYRSDGTGLQSDLGLSDSQYSTCLSILYVGYILMQVPSNIMVNRITWPAVYIGIAMLLWGMLSVLAGITHNFGGMIACRFTLGFVEAAFLPAALLILSKWYTRRELTTRNAILFAGNLISNAFASLVGAGILGNMEGIRGYAAWRWMYFIEGAVTMVIAIFAMFILPDLPTNSRGFTDEELLVAQMRIAEDVGESDTDDANDGVFHGLKLALKDYKIYVMSIALTCYVIGLSFNAFFPSLTSTLGFARIPTLLMSAPPWVFAVIVSLINAWHADKTQEKFWHIAGPIFVGLVGFIISMSTLNTAARYIALFLQASSYAGFIVVFSWISSSFPRPPAKRAVAIAFINAFSQLGNIAGSYVWQMRENGYRKSYGVVVAMFMAALIGCFIFRQILVGLNKKIDAGEDAWESSPAAQQKTEAVQHLEPGDGANVRKGFRYLV